MLDRSTTGCFQTTPFGCFLAFLILFPASHFTTTLFVLLFWSQPTKTGSEREGAEVGFPADRDVLDPPWLWGVEMGMRPAHGY